LEYQRGSLEIERRPAVLSHLEDCEFCAAEVEFYSFYPQRDENVVPAVIPEPLFDLAEALLKTHRGQASLENLIARNAERSRRRRPH
jgi:hypothetical protein